MNTNSRIYGAVLLVATLTPCLALAQAALPAYDAAPNDSWHSDSVVFIAGLDGLKQNAVGSLAMLKDDLAFSAKDAHEQIPLTEITLVSIGDERIATGGASAKVVRKIPLFGLGAAAGAVTSKMVDVLTVEYWDIKSGYHGAVFEVPKGQAEIAQRQLMALAAPPRPENGPPRCDEAAPSKTLLVAAIDDKGQQLPAEYRVLLYEQLMAELRKSYAAGTVLRVGDRAAGCASATLHVSVSAFKKGNEKLRSSTGPVGLFVGGTSVAFSARLIDRYGTVVFEKNLKNSKHGDSDSLGVAQDVAQSVSKRLSKLKGSNFEAAS